MSIPNWWGDWRQGLTPHTGNLQATDLLECTQIVGGQPVNTVITGQQIINAAPGGSPAWGSITGTLSAQTDLDTALNGKQATLVSGTNIKTVNGNNLLGSGNVSIQTNPRTIGSVNGTAITGTSIQISASVLIPAGTIVANNTIYIKAFINKTAGSGVTTPRYYVNTANTLTGATYLGAGGGMSTTVYFQRFERNIFFDGTNLNSFLSGTSAANDYSLSGMTLTAFNPSVDNYLIFAISNGITTPDNGNFRRVIVQVYD